MKCSHKPEDYLGQPIGQYHCPACGVMVLAGMSHPEICFCNGHADYQAMCDRCSPGWEKELEKCNDKQGF